MAHPKDAVYGHFARLGKAAASPKRLELLDLLCQGPRTVESLAGQAALSVANTSRHLQVLRAARLVEVRKRGVYAEYRLADDEVCRFLLALRQLAESRLAEVEQIARDSFGGTGELEPVDADDLLRRARDGEVVVIDVRPVEEYRAGHVPGAVSVPLPELEARLSELPPDREIVAYCRGPYCAMAAQAVERLRHEGFEAHRMESGVPEWRVRGWPVEAEEPAT